MGGGLHIWYLYICILTCLKLFGLRIQSRGARACPDGVDEVWPVEVCRWRLCCWLRICYFIDFLCLPHNADGGCAISLEICFSKAGSNTSSSRHGSMRSL